jgi:hypothetical protein
LVIHRHNAVERRVQDRGFARLTALQFNFLLAQPLFGQPPFDDFALQLFVGCGKFLGSLRNSSIELVGDSLLFSAEPRLSEADGRLIRGDAQQQCLRGAGKIGALTSHHEEADVALHAKPQGDERHVVVPDGGPHQWRPLVRVIAQRLVKHQAYSLRPGRQPSRLSDSNHLDGRVAGWIVQAHVHEIQAEHARECVAHGTNDLGWIAAGPHGGKSEHAHQIIDTALKTLDLVGVMLGLYFHVRTPRTSA